MSAPPTAPQPTHRRSMLRQASCTLHHSLTAPLGASGDRNGESSFCIMVLYKIRKEDVDNI